MKNASELLYIHIHALPSYTLFPLYVFILSSPQTFCLSGLHHHLPKLLFFSFSVSLMNDIEQIRPSSAAIFQETGRKGFPPEKTQLPISTDVMTDSDTEKPDFGLELPSLTIFGPGMIKPAHHFKGSTNDETNLVQHSKTATNHNMKDETRAATSSEQSNVTVQSRSGTATSHLERSESVSLNGGGICEVMLQLERRPESRLTDIDV